MKSQKAILQHRKPQLGSTHIFLECDQSFLTCKEPFYLAESDEAFSSEPS